MDNSSLIGTSVGRIKAKEKGVELRTLYLIVVTSFQESSPNKTFPSFI